MIATGILGGTFDPVHIGHLRLAIEVQQATGLQHIELVPLSKPAHRDPPILPADIRLAMLEAAIQDEAGLSVNPLELHRPGISYTVDTLEHLRETDSERPLSLITGMDAFAGLTTWHRWQSLLELAHIIVADRPGHQPALNPSLQELLAGHQCKDPEPLHHQPAGAIHFIDIPPLDISSTRIRAMIKVGQSTRYLLPDAVEEMIHQHDYYRASSED